MIRRSNAPLAALIGAALTAILVAGCGASTATPGPSGNSPSGAPSASASRSAAANASASAAQSAYASASASAAAQSCSSPDVGLPHASAALEDLLPSTIGGIEMCKFSLTVSAYIASTTGADNALYPLWLVKFGKTPTEVNMAVATDLTKTENFRAHAIEVPGASAAALVSGFGEVAQKAGWKITDHPNLIPGKAALEIINPAPTVGGLSAGYVYGNGDVMYTIITDNANLLTEALIRLP